VEQKKCKQCGADFTVTDSDLVFYKKISPTFDGETFEIPAPTLCPDCRRRGRLAWRNNSFIYKRKCDITGKELISPFAPNSPHKIYSSDYWWSDKWNPLDYGQEYDKNRPFFDQLQELHGKVPIQHSFNANNENSPYVNCSSNVKNCYLVQSATDSEDCLYSTFVLKSKDCIDCLRVSECEKCYECVNVDNSYECYFCTNASNNSESLFLDNCKGCKNCFACANLQNKQYWAYNKRVTEKEFLEIKNDFLSLAGEERDRRIDEIKKFLIQFPKRYAYILKSENCSGDQIYSCADVHNSFYINNSENLKYCSSLNLAKDSMDHDFWGEQTQRVYESGEVGGNCNSIFFSKHSHGNCQNIYYSIMVYNNSKNCFGCVGLRQKEYCVLNKQYSKEEYESLVKKIIRDMISSGEWGQPIPMKMSLFYYNETLAQDYFPLTKKEAEKLEANWQNEDFSPKYAGSYYKPKAISSYNQKEIKEVLSGVIKCIKTGKPFKIQSKELAFYIKNNIQIPEKHPYQRYIEKFRLINPPKLWHRKCMNRNCTNEFETTYAPDRPEKVYCEKCYQQSVI
jgi:hypothetical protein